MRERLGASYHAPYHGRARTSAVLDDLLAISGDGRKTICVFAMRCLADPVHIVKFRMNSETYIRAGRKPGICRQVEHRRREVSVPDGTTVIQAAEAGHRRSAILLPPALSTRLAASVSSR